MIPEYKIITINLNSGDNYYYISPVRNQNHYYWFLNKLVNSIGFTFGSLNKSTIDRTLFDIDTFIREFFTEKEDPSDPKHVKLVCTNEV